MSESDWRLRGQEKYLKGVTLTRARWHRPRTDWDHDHYAFCWDKFGDESLADALHEGWATLDRYHWICDRCSADFQNLFGWERI